MDLTLIEALEELARISEDGLETLIQDGADPVMTIADVIVIMADAAGGLDCLDLEKQALAVDVSGIRTIDRDGMITGGEPLYRVVPIELTGSTVEYTTIYQYVDDYGSDISHYKLDPGVNEIRVHDDPDVFTRLPEDIEDPVIQRYAEKHGQVWINWGESGISLMPEQEAFWGTAYACGDESGHWIGELGWFRDYESARATYDGWKKREAEEAKETGRFTRENTDNCSDEDLSALNEMWEYYRKDTRYSAMADRDLFEKILEQYASSSPFEIGDELTVI